MIQPQDKENDLMNIVLFAYSLLGSGILEHLDAHLPKEAKVVAIVTDVDARPKKKFLGLQLLRKLKTRSLRQLSQLVLSKLIYRSSPIFFIPQIAATATKSGISVYDQKILRNDPIALLQSLSTDLIIVATFGQKISKEIIEHPKFGVINFHPSYLPQYRGGCPAYSAIKDGKESSGVTLHRMTQVFDAGEIIAQKEIAILPDDTTYQFEFKAAEVGQELLLNAINTLLDKGVLETVSQDNSNSSYCYKNSEIDPFISWGNTTSSILNNIRACYHPNIGGAYFYHRFKRYYIIEASIAEKAVGCKPGQITTMDQQSIVITTQDSAIKITKVFHNGHYYAENFLTLFGK